MLKKIVLICCLTFVWCFSTMQAEASELFEGKEQITIVIDPGHGGENLGTIANEGFEEKEITLKTANALVEELSRYEGVQVIMTRTKDEELSLKERAQIAEDADADFLFSLHYNASEYHTLFGAEVWIPLEEPYHAYGYQFAYMQLQEMQDMGLFVRGIKTRKNDSGTDYYGIIRESVARNIPAVIIEHCHVDEERDAAFCNSDEIYEEFGRRDAAAIAKFLGLEPYEDTEKLLELSAEDTIENTYLDDSAPEICQIEVEKADYDNGLLTISVSAADYDTPLMYYDYSLDGGKTYSKLFPWPECDMLTGTYDDCFSLILEIPNQTMPRVILRAYNKFDICTESNELSGFYAFHTPIEATAEAESPKENSTQQKLDEYQEVLLEQSVSKTKESIEFKRFLLLIAFVVFWILLLVFMCYSVYRFFGRKGRHHRKR